MKKCTTCNIEKELLMFPKRKDSPSGLRKECKECRSKKSSKFYEENKDSILASIDKEKKKEYDKLYSTKYRENNRDKYNESQRKCYHARKEDPMYRLENNIRARIRISFKVSRWNKNNKTKDILGCDYNMLKNHIESLFTDGMTWNKIGNEIHIDHIIPVSSAKNEEELIKLNHYTNLQPLWAKDNLIKSNKTNYYGNN
jgi:hypothetical protein